MSVICGADVVDSPNVESLASSSVLVSWSSPRQHIGDVRLYVIQRRRVREDSASEPVDVTVQTTTPDDDLNQTYRHIDESSALWPFTVYEYRVAVQTSAAAGLTYSDWSRVVTRPAS